MPPISTRRRIDWFDVAVLALLACVSLWVVGLDVIQASTHHVFWTGTDGLFLGDQMQYLAWIKDASEHFLISDLYVIRSTPHDYFQPEIVISAGITKLGVAPWLALLFWKPVVVLAAFLAIRAYCGQLLAERFDRRAALVLALFFGSFGVEGDFWVPFWSWGYPFGLLAIAALAGSLVTYARARAERRLTWIAPVLGLIASFSHPWQGEVLILVVIGTEAITWRGKSELLRSLALPGITVATTALPLLYFEILDRADGTWRMAQSASRHHYSLWAIVVPLLPLLIFSVPAYCRRPRSFLEAATRIWPLAAVAIFGLSSSGLSGTPLHAFAGITVPLAVLAVEGARGLGLRRIPRWRLTATLLIAAATIPASVHELRVAHVFDRPAVGNADFIRPSEHRALDYLSADRQPGAVLTRGYLGLLVPEATGRHTYAGDCLWSEPDCHARQIEVYNLFEKGFGPSAARAFVRSTHARFLLEDCQSRANLLLTLGPMIRSVKRFGCASVYEVT